MADTKNLAGKWAFLIGVVIAVILGIFTADSPNFVAVDYNVWLAWLLVLVGLVVGFLNISGRETSSFLMSGVVLIIASALGAGFMGGVPYLPNILETLLLIFVPATIIVAIKNVFNLARN